MSKRIAILSVFVLALCGWAGPAAAQPVAFDPNDYAVYKPGVPDVNKPGVPPMQTDPNDMSCWMAAASNLLGGAGYGTAGAQGIYNQLRNDLGIGNLGCADLAINYWLYTYGKNPASPEFKPNAAYTDVTVVDKSGAGLTLIDYNFLLDELKRCQYAAVLFDYPPHCITLVGGNYANPAAPGQVSLSVWHDSDRDKTPTGDDVYRNDFVTSGFWDLYELVGGVRYEYMAQKYVTLCPGLNKPEEAMKNYDVAWFKQDPAQSGTWTPGFRVAGTEANVYAPPMWDPVDPNRRVTIHNEYLTENYKEVWLLVDYKDRDPNRAETITLLDDKGFQWDPTVTESNDHGQSLYYWKLDYQPAWETIVFPSDAYSTLDDYVKDWDVATICIPEPATAALLVLGGLAALRRRRRR